MTTTTNTADTTTGARHRRPTFPTPHRGPMLRALLAKAITDRLSLAGIVGFLMVGMGAMVGALWPPLRDTFADISSGLFDEMMKAIPGGDLTTAAGWVNAELMSIVAPAGVIAVAVISAARGVAGEEEDKTLGVLLAAPVTRLTFLSVKTAAMMLHVLVVGVLLVVGLVVGDLLGDLGLSANGILGATAHTVALGIFFGVLAVLIGATSGNRRLTTAITGALAGLAFAVSVFLPLSDSLAEGAKVSPWYYFSASDPLVNGADPGHLIVLATAITIPAVIAAVIFRIRDLRG